MFHNSGTRKSFKNFLINYQKSIINLKFQLDASFKISDELIIHRLLTKIFL